jgi:L-threonylcarbamoyladenylate synthase
MSEVILKWGFMSEHSLPLDDTVLFDPAAPGAIEMAAELIAAGGVVAIPTDTVYGIAASLSQPEALRRVYEIKGRDRAKPLPILVSSTDALRGLAPAIEPNIALLLNVYWPGPLTVILTASTGMPSEVLAPDETIGVRLPNHMLAIELIDKAGGAVACTSANISGESAASSAREVMATIGRSLDGIVQGGVSPGGVPSTVIRITDGDIVLLREGPIPIEHIRATWEDFRTG